MTQTKWSDVYGGDQLLTGAKFSIDFFNVPSSVVDTNMLKLYGKASELPDMTTEMVDTRIGSFVYQQPDALGAELDWTFTVVETASASILPMLYDWRQLVMGSESGNATRGYNQTKAIQTIYNLYGEKPSRIEIFNCYPVNIPAPKPDVTSTGTVIEYPVLFKISRWKPEGSSFK